MKRDDDSYLTAGRLWLDSDTGELKIYNSDGDSTKWVGAGAKLYSFLYPHKNYYNISRAQQRKYDHAAHELAKYVLDAV